MSEKRRLEVTIETDGEYCGAGCDAGESDGMTDYCMGVVTEYDWKARKWKRTSFCMANAKEITDGND